MTSDLVNLLSGCGEGRVPLDSVPEIERVLAANWHTLEGACDGGMSGYKVNDRTEDMTWQRPVLRFSIERHGAAAFGSSRAEVQHWAVDIERKVACLEHSARRQLYTTARPDMKPPARQVAQAILRGVPSDHLSWVKEDQVLIDVKRAIPPTCDDNASNRRRLRKELHTMLAPGWHVETRGPRTYAVRQARG